MKTNVRALLFKCLFLSFFVLGCSQDNEVSSEEFNFSTKMSSNVDTSKFMNPIILGGNFEQWSDSQNNFNVYTETDQDKHLFVVQGASQSTGLKSISEVYFLDHVLYLEDKSGNNVMFYLKKEESELIVSQMKNNFSFVSNVVGTGIMHYTFPKNSADFENITFLNLKKEVSALGFVTSAHAKSRSCDNGGEGATSCSTSGGGSSSSCSVSCGAGFYACCNNSSFLTQASCKCERVAPIAPN